MGLLGPSEEEIWEQFANEIGAQFVKGGFSESAKVLARVGEWTITFDTYSVTSGGGPEDAPATSYCIRVRAPFRGMDGFRFVASRQPVFNAVLRWALGGIRNLLGRAEESDDRDFSIRGNNESKVRAFIANERIRRLIQSEPSILLKVHHPRALFGGGLPKGVDELYLEVPGRITEVGDIYVGTPTGATRVNPLGVERVKGIDWQTERELRSLASGEGHKSLSVERLKTLYDLFVETLNQLVHIGSASSTMSHLPIDRG